MLSAFVIGSPGVVDPVSGDPQFSFNLPAWHAGVLAGLRGALHRRVLIENDVNLAAVAEHAMGAAAGADDFVLMWIGTGVGLATMLGGRLHRGVSGAAGEIGWLPVPGAPVTSDVKYPAGGGLQWLVGSDAIGALAAEFGLAGPGAGGGGTPGPCGLNPADSVRAAVAATAANAAAVAGAVAAAERPDGTDGRAGQFLDELARRVALGAVAVCTVIDPGLVVLGGEIGLAGGRRWPAGSRPRWPGSARCTHAWRRQRCPASRCCAVRSSPPCSWPAPTCSPPSRASARRGRAGTNRS